MFFVYYYGGIVYIILKITNFKFIFYEFMNLTEEPEN